jgi:hypothetical protein
MAERIERAMNRKCSARGGCGRSVTFLPADYIQDNTGKAPSGVACTGCGHRIPVTFAELPPQWIDLLWERRH